MKKIGFISTALFCFFIWIACNNDKEQSKYNGWEKATGNSDGNKYSSLTQIDTGNVAQLQVAWEFHTGDMDTAAHSQIQCNRLLWMVLCTSRRPC